VDAAREGRLDITLPTAANAAAEQKESKDLVVGLTADGRMFINDQPVEDAGLTAVLTPHPRESFVVVRADRVTVLERFVGVVDEVRGLGFRQVSLEVVRS
jgi:biopolymer transport protein ExbD